MEEERIDLLAQVAIWYYEEGLNPVSYTHLRAHETPEHLVCRLLLEKKKKNKKKKKKKDKNNKLTKVGPHNKNKQTR